MSDNENETQEPPLEEVTPQAEIQELPITNPEPAPSDLASDPMAARGGFYAAPGIPIVGEPGPELIAFPEGVTPPTREEIMDALKPAEEEEPPPPPLFPEGSVIKYNGPSTIIELSSGRRIHAGTWIYYQPDMDEWMKLLMPHGHTFDVMPPALRANTPDSAIE